MKTAVVIVNWNETGRTARCLRSIAADASAAQAYVVDNASSDGTVERLSHELPNVRFIRLPTNRGYAAGCNAGAAEAIRDGADAILFLNNDTELEPGATRALQREAVSHPDAILGPTIVFAADPARVWSAGGAVERPWMVNRHVGQGERLDARAGSRRVDWTTGCAMFVRAETYRRLGPFDESLFMYLEDLDWCLRGARLGIETRVVPDAVVRHEVSATASRLPSPSVLYYGCRNTYRIAFRHASAARRLVMFPALLLTVARLVVRNAFWPGRRTDLLYRARTLAILDFVRGRTGPLLAAKP